MVNLLINLRLSLSCLFSLQHLLQITEMWLSHRSEKAKAACLDELKMHVQPCMAVVLIFCGKLLHKDGPVHSYIE